MDAVAGAAACAGCGQALDVAVAGDPLIGIVVVSSGRFLSRNVIVVGTAGDAVSLLGRGDEPVTVSAADFAGMRRVEVPAPATIGEAGRLWSASRAEAMGTIKGSWPHDRLQAIGDEFAGRDLSRRRAAAVDAIALGRQVWLPRAGLTESELSWYQARHAALRGDLREMLAWLAKLPPDGYAVRVALLLSTAAGLRADPALAALATAQLAPFEQSSPDARALRRVLGRTAADDPPAAVVEFASTLPGRWGAAAAPALAGAEAIRDRRRIPIRPRSGPAVRALDAYVAGLAGSNLNDYVALLRDLPRALLDDLVDAGALTAVPADNGIFPADLRAYLRCRLHPGRVDAAELTTAGFVAESARRHYLARDADALGGLDPADETVRHYRALLAYVRDRDRAHVDDLWPATRALVDDLSAATGEVSEQLAADRSAWPLLREAAVAGRLTVSRRVRDAHPEFASWFDVCGLTRLVYDGDWAGAVRQAGALTGTIRDWPLADEVASLAAFARWQLGEDAAALATLDAGPDAPFRAGMVLNASIIAAGRGSTDALEPLGRLSREASDRRVGNAALLRAIGLWLADDAVPDYPAPLADLVHARLANPIEDDALFLTLTKFSANNDAAWLAGASVHFVNQTQAEIMRFFQTRCRILDENRPDTLADLGQVLVPIWQRSPRPEWIARERDWLVELVLDLVHRPFGEAVGLTGVIHILLDGGVLEPGERYILSTQAGAHIAASLGDGEDIRPEAEQKLLFDPAQRWLRNDGALADPLRERVGEELARCVAIAAVSIAQSQTAVVDRLSDDYNAVVQRRQWDHANIRFLQHRQVTILDELAALAGRLGAYQALLGRLPVPEDLRELAGTVGAQATSLANEVARLRRDVLPYGR
ncbi:hypothetical protein [Asanoa siamensis]|uniref:Uncharacterized protein n=1 Tax=Asanoa siamensis TaxID=926357 RepID=A0ABQ4CR82_9ACTN|nr:hypothetical protein [Asanoa siamensis]GIF73796.1 hypothetical protein Asi02nite_33140 [Asanoa siamensis]